MSGSPSDGDEAARVRRRWLTLGELLAIAAVAISALTLWNSYRERTNAEAQRNAEALKTSRAAAILVLKATPDREGHVLTLAPRAESQTIQAQTIVFPRALGLSAVETTGDARIERGWFADALVDARKAAGVKDDTVGDARLPLLVTTRFLVDGEPQLDRALYALGYATDHAFLTGTRIKLKGLSRLGGVASEAAGKRRLEALAKNWLGR